MKNKIITVLVIILILVLGCVAGVYFKKENTNEVSEEIQETKEKEVFVLGLDDSFPPMGYRDDSNEIVGFDIDVAKEVCERMDAELKLQPISWDAKEQELNSGNIDCIWNGMSKTEEREKVMTLSNAYMKNRMVFVVKNDSAYETTEELKGKIIGVQSGSSAEEMLEGAEIFSELKKVIPYADNMTAFMDLETNQTDAVFVDEVLANYYIASNNKDYKIINAEMEEEEYVIGFRKQDTELSEKINTILKEMKADGSLAKISEKWFGKDVTIIE